MWRGIRWQRKKKIGLALGSGGARGWAHLGVLRAIEESGCSVHAVAGTSMGALVGGFFAADQAAMLTDLALHFDWKQFLRHFFELTLPRQGLIDGKRVVQTIRKMVRTERFSDLRIPFRAVATNVQTGAEVVLGDGSLIDAIRASIAIPGIFTPVLRHGVWLVDGGLVNPVPVSVVREMGADLVMAVDVSGLQSAAGGAKKRTPARALPQPAGCAGTPAERLRRAWQMEWPMLRPARREAAPDNRPTIFDILGGSVRVAESQIAAFRLKIDPPDVLIRPPVGQLSFMDFHRAEEAIAAGYQSAVQALKAARV